MKLSRLLMTGALLIIAARQLFPSIDAETGSGSLFVLAAWALGLLVLVHCLLRTGPSATIPAAFIALVALSTWRAGYRYPPMHMLAEWIGVLCVWAAVRRSTGPSAMMHPGMLIVVLAVAESMLTWRQVKFTIPELLEQYRRGDPSVMRDLANIGVEPGFMFQARLEAELPWGTFGHTNALAGFLLLTVPFLVALAVPAWTAKANGRMWAARLLGAIAIVVVISALGLTKCRSAWIGVVASLAMMAAASASVRAVVIRRWPWAAVALGALVVAFVWKGGNSLESFRYRLEYWRGTVPIIAENPWVGVGWGNFRDHYLPHKLVESSEEIADPHNFFMEIAAVAGIPAAVAYVWWLITTMIGLLRSNPDDPGRSSSKRSPVQWLGLAAIILCAAGIVVFLGYSSSWSEIGGWGIVVAILATLALEQLSPTPTIHEWRIATAAAMFGLHVHLLAAGGVGHPGMMLAVWTLAAAAGSFDPAFGWKRWRDLGLLSAMLAVGGMLGCLDLARRTFERDPLLGRIRNANTPMDDAASRLFGRAQSLTPGDADLWAEIARQHRRRMSDAASGAKSHFGAARTAFDRAIELQPLRSVFWHERGVMTLEAASHGLISMDKAGSAAEDLRRAVERYPNSPVRQADEAFVLAAVLRETPTPAGLRQSLEEWRTIKKSLSTDLGSRLGRSAAATLSPQSERKVGRAAERALELDAATPHFDKKLLPAERAWLAALNEAIERRRGTSE